VETEIQLQCIRKLAAGRNGVSAPRPDIFYPLSRERLGTQCTGVWVSVRAGMDGRRIFHIHLESISQPSRL